MRNLFGMRLRSLAAARGNGTFSWRDAIAFLRTSNICWRMGVKSTQWGKGPSSSTWACLAVDCGKVIPVIKFLEAHQREVHDGHPLWLCPEPGCEK